MSSNSQTYLPSLEVRLTVDPEGCKRVLSNTAKLEKNMTSTIMGGGLSIGTSTSVRLDVVEKIVDK